MAWARGDPEMEVGIPTQSEAVAVRLTLAAALAAIRRQPISAATLWGAAEHIDADVGVDDRPVHARLRARWEPQARADAGDPPTWDAAWQAGAHMSIDDALALAAGWRGDVDAPDQSAAALARGALSVAPLTHPLD